MEHIKFPSGRVLVQRRLAGGGVIVISGHVSADGRGIVVEAVTFQPAAQQQRAA